MQMDTKLWYWNEVVAVEPFKLMYSLIFSNSFFLPCHFVSLNLLSNGLRHDFLYVGVLLDNVALSMLALHFEHASSLGRPIVPHELIRVILDDIVSCYYFIDFWSKM